MEVTCTQENLSRGLNLVSHIASKNVNLPILNNVLLKTKDKILKLCATNLEIGITSLVRGKTDQEGEFTTEAKILTEYINLLPKGNIELQINDGNLQINCGNHQTQIKGSNTSDFPLIPTTKKEKGYQIPLSILKDALQQVVFAASLNDLRPEISGVLFSFTDQKLTLVATDSYRLTEKSILINQDSTKTSANQESVDIILPLRTIQEILRILNLNHDVLINNDKVDTVGLYIEDNQILLSDDGTELVSKLIEGQYPDYKQIIPQDFRTNIIINKDELQKAVKAASLFTKTGIYDVGLKINIGKGEVEIFAENSQLGKNSIKINTQVSGDDNDIVLNFKYLLDGLQNINTEQVAIDIVDHSVPCIVRPYQNESVDQEYLYLIMPIRQ